MTKYIETDEHQHKSKKIIEIFSWDECEKIYQTKPQFKSWSWRYLIAQSVMLRTLTSEIPESIDDIYLLHIIDLLNSKQTDQENFDIKAYCQVIDNSYKIWLTPFRFKLEVFIIAGATDEDLRTIFPEILDLKIFENYRKIFFDIEDYRDNKCCLEYHIFENSYDISDRETAQLLLELYTVDTSNTAQSEKLWKILATQNNPSELKEFYEMPNKKFKEDKRIKKLIEYIAQKEKERLKNDKV